MTDRLSLTNALADANIDRQKAERIATEIFDAIHDNVATRQDLQNVEAALRVDIAAVETALKADIAAVETALKADIAAVETALKADIAAVRAELREVELSLEAKVDRTVVRLGSLIVILAGVILAAIRYLPHA